MAPIAAELGADVAMVDTGIKDGKYAFHTGLERDPWWQVDLGASRPAPGSSSTTSIFFFMIDPPCFPFLYPIP
jgi:hypothetical protein